MIKLVIGVVILIGLIVYSPRFYNQFAIWDASDPADDDSYINTLLFNITPTVTPSQVKQAVELKAGAVVVDVRTQKEYDEGHIPEAILIPEQTLYTEIPKMFPDTNKTIYLYCHTGHRGAVSTRLLRSMSYDKAYNIDNGLNGWKAAGNQVDSLYAFPD
jgi:rhodanese-related sulfurtransferase